MNRHEYEINQLINPKKDIVKSNSKHRDKIETLIQGRRIGGIVGGGSTPEKTRYIGWYLEGGGAQFLIGDIKDNYLVLYGNSLSLMNVFTTEGYDFQMAPGQKTIEWFKTDASEVLGKQIDNVEFNDIKVLKPGTETVFSPHAIY